LIANHQDPAVFDIAVLVQAMAREAGIKFEIETLDWAAQLARYNRGDFQAMAFSYSSRLDPVLSFDAIIGDKRHDPRKIWDERAALELLTQAKSTADHELRQAILDDLHTWFLRDVPAVALYNYPRIIALRSNVKGFSGWPGAQLRLWGVQLQ
jgi:peptide/nickel transport system substrate-binding protein